MGNNLTGERQQDYILFLSVGLATVNNGYMVSSGEWDNSAVFTLLSGDFIKAILPPALCLRSAI